jgi:hypothetical protein
VAEFVGDEESDDERVRPVWVRLKTNPRMKAQFEARLREFEASGHEPRDPHT